MVRKAPAKATAQAIQGIIPLARSAHTFLSVYLPTGPARTTTEGSRLRLAALLEEAAQRLADPAWAAGFEKERKAVVAYMRSLRPGGQGLCLLSSGEAGEWQALWLPDQVKEHVRFGPGAYVLPLLDVLDEWEPMGVALVTKDVARLMVLDAGRIEEVRRVDSDVPGKNKAGGWAAWESARIQRHLLVHAQDHLKQAVEELAREHRRHPFRRLFLGGAPEAVGLFKKLLPAELKGKLAGELPLDLFASDDKIRAQAMEAGRAVERKGEQALVEELITRAAKEQGAVAGLDPTLWALNRRELHLLVLAGEMN